MAYTWLPEWNPNMATPSTGWSLGQLLMPNYLGGRPWEENSAGPLALDPNDIEGSFRARTGSDIRTALQDLAPGYNLGAGPIDVNTLNQIVPFGQQRAPAKEDPLETMIGFGVPALLGAGIAGWANAAGGAASGGGMDWWGTDYMGDFGFPDVNVNTMMPPAVPETVDTLKSWGLTETSPGVWAQPAMPSLQMGPADWLKLGSQAVSGLGSLAGGAAPNVNTMGGLGNLASMFGSTGGLLGAGLGGLAGMLNGTKKIDDAVTTESGYNSTLSPAAEAEMLKTIRGDYLNPDSNPWLKSTFDRSAGEIQSKLSPSFGHMEAFGQNSGFQNAYGRSLADLSTSLYGGNYNNERTRQFGAASAAPNYTKKSTTPVYSNPLGGMFSGAMAGGLLGGKLFGG